MKPLPLPLRIAAGVAVTAAEQARKLPEHLVGLPITVASQALQLSMRVQQGITELAVRGDQALAGLRDSPAQAEWATFDEDEVDSADGAGDERGTGGRGGAAEPSTGGAGATGDAATEKMVADRTSEVRTGGEGARTGTGRRRPSRSGGAGDEERHTRSSRPADDGPTAHRPPRSRRQEAGTGRSASGGRGSAGSAGGGSGTHAEAPKALPEYPDLSLPQLRGHLRGLSAADLSALLEYEQGQSARPEYVRMLANRLRTVTGE
ncbi:lipid droplet-associated protein [Actinoalloteichus caeruleus]|uniref:lipid droplet-associated protein n=1 Tax=Actinoalloteichus cyanogriseus TaxID=2893586 RepID=UPI0004AB3B8F|nr:lipid droplet-associated protein [Actinoalloteichus caeruleus]